MEKPERIEDPTIVALAQKLSAGGYERVLFAEGDSWFDIYTPAPHHEPNLLDAIRSSRRALVVDTSRIGSKASAMASGRQAANTRAMLDTFHFSGLLLSAGGNDLKDAFTKSYGRAAAQRFARNAPADDELEALAADPRAATEYFDDVVRSIIKWIGFRDQSKYNRDTPIFLHGYDYLQPRPAPARVSEGGLPLLGPWLHPALSAIGKTDKEMRETAKIVIDELNARLEAIEDRFAKVHLIRQRGTLQLAAERSDKRSNDWMDEIHPTPEGFAKLGALWTKELEAKAVPA
jgi:hypothetical protein